MSPPILQAWCPTCAAMAMPDDRGLCVWCGTVTGAGAIEEAVPSRLAIVHSPERAAAFVGPLRPKKVFCGCGGMKTRGTGQCWACRQEAGHRPRVPAGQQMPRLIDEDTIQEARRLYASGLSIRETAIRILPKTGYANARSCANSLFDHFKRRGWQLRDRIASVVDSNRRRAEPPAPPRICAGVRLNAPRRGAPCRARAMTDSDFCVSHAPEREDALREQLARMRARRAA